MVPNFKILNNEKMKSKQVRTKQAESAIKMLEKAIELGNKKRIIEAYDYADEIDWSNLNDIAIRWDSLVDQANELYV